MNRKVVVTSDGSHSIYVEELDEHYHSTHGALQEAQHVFIDNGLGRIQNKEVKILEVGFGTGLNALITMKFAKENELTVNYHGVEAYPVKMSDIEQLNYLDLVKGADKKEFYQLHSNQYNKVFNINKYFKFIQLVSRLEDVRLDSDYDVIYFDAFGPRAQSEMWQKPILLKMFNALRSNAFLVTYCAQGQFKRDLKSVGFEVVSLPGPPGKREMTMAVKP